MPTVHPGPVLPSPIPTPAVNFHDEMRPSFDTASGYDQNRDSNASTGRESVSNPVPSQVPAPAKNLKGGAVGTVGPPAPKVTPDFEALGTLLDRLNQDQESLRLILAGRPSLNALDAPERAKAEAILADQDTAEQLLQARLQAAPLPAPLATPASARPLATPTPIP
jgi:hypothetical protein